MDIPERVWIVKAHVTPDMHRHFYVGVETEQEARDMIVEQHPHDVIVGAKIVKNVEDVQWSEVRQVPEGWEGDSIF